MPRVKDPSDQGAGARIARGLLAGVIAGAAAAFAMDRFQAAVSAFGSNDGDGGEPATEQAADAVARRVSGGPLPAADKPLGGQAAHYLLGLGLGAADGIAAEFAPVVTAGGGAAFGVTAATLLDEGLVPALGLTDAPWRTGAGTHLHGYASHIVFGGVTELVRRQVRATLLPDRS